MGGSKAGIETRTPHRAKCPPIRSTTGHLNFTGYSSRTHLHSPVPASRARFRSFNHNFRLYSTSAWPTQRLNLDPSSLAMSGFSSKPLKPSPFLTYIRKHPFLLFGLPFVGLMVGSSFVLENFTKTRYDYQATKVQSMTWEEDRGLSKNRKKVDLREEYYVSGISAECFLLSPLLS